MESCLFDFQVPMRQMVLIWSRSQDSSNLSPSVGHGNNYSFSAAAIDPGGQDWQDTLGEVNEMIVIVVNPLNPLKDFSGQNVP